MSPYLITATPEEARLLAEQEAAVQREKEKKEAEERKRLEAEVSAEIFTTMSEIGEYLF